MQENLGEIEKACGNAWSLRGETNKNTLVYLGAKQTNFQTYFYYKDKENGTYYYETEYDRERVEIEKQKKRKRFSRIR